MNRHRPEEDERRLRRLEEFSFAAALTALNASGGRVLLSDEDARAVVRVGRTIFAELDEPTSPPPEERPMLDEDPTPTNYVDDLYEPKGAA